MNKAQLTFGLKYWRLAIHLIFKTKHFGVNNLWWARQPSAIGWHWYEICWGILTVMPIWRNYQSLRVRSCLGWIPQADCEALGYDKAIQKSIK
ncbi:hypothetical protein [Hydrogenovibrio marinus]|uniref:Uncharacterized protein n=1 Tax=Hydrogenovibrio marinus TaxID=28885 RepID=A0A066ZNA0_HYDMR|nr:hypothetical protein [Hydrogenovibrio marinus]KDN95002.1 hypothetical protein EI16_01435 [Hydrogenovibrio marinus]BBN59467.1 hypothetical protein HVMH_1061 [Hydrogenovibrio marinus]